MESHTETFYTAPYQAALSLSSRSMDSSSLDSRSISWGGALLISFRISSCVIHPSRSLCNSYTSCDFKSQSFYLDNPETDVLRFDNMTGIEQAIKYIEQELSTREWSIICSHQFVMNCDKCEGKYCCDNTNPLCKALFILRSLASTKTLAGSDPTP